MLNWVFNSWFKKYTSNDCLFILYKRESCSSVDSGEFEPETLVDSRVLIVVIRHWRCGFNIGHDNSEVKMGLEEAHRAQFELGVDSLGNWEYTCVIPLCLFSGLFCGFCPWFFLSQLEALQLWFFHVKIIVSICLDCLIEIVIYCLKFMKITAHNSYIIFFHFNRATPHSWTHLGCIP